MFLETVVALRVKVCKVLDERRRHPAEWRYAVTQKVADLPLWLGLLVGKSGEMAILRSLAKTTRDARQQRVTQSWRQGLIG